MIRKHEPLTFFNHLFRAFDEEELRGGITYQPRSETPYGMIVKLAILPNSHNEGGNCKDDDEEDNGGGNSEHFAASFDILVDKENCTKQKKWMI